MHNSLHVLFVGLTDPFPPTNGQRLRDWFLLKALAREGHVVSLICFTDSPPTAETLTALREVCPTVETVPAPQNHESLLSSYGARLKATMSSMPYGAWRFRSSAMSNAITRHLRRERTDVVICDDIYTIHNIPPCPVPVLLNKHDITHVILGRYLRHQRNPFVKAYGWTEYGKLKRWELAACRTAAGVIACSELDREILEDYCPGLRVAVAPNIIDPDDYSVSDHDDGRTALYVGAMDWYPNQDAVEFFARRILPSLRRSVPGIRFVVAGRNPTDSFRRKFHEIPDILFTGTVADIRTEIAKATVCVVPLRIGSGTRLKILEAAAMGKAVVSTTLGAEGLDFAPNEQIVLADEPIDFARAVADLFGDAARRRALGMAARARVQALYSLPVLERSLRDAFKELVECNIAHSGTPIAPNSGPTKRP